MNLADIAGSTLEFISSPEKLKFCFISAVGVTGLYLMYKKYKASSLEDQLREDTKTIRDYIDSVDYDIECMEETLGECHIPIESLREYAQNREKGKSYFNPVSFSSMVKRHVDTYEHVMSNRILFKAPSSLMQEYTDVMQRFCSLISEFDPYWPKPEELSLEEI